MAVNLEIERKFLVEYPDCNKLDIVRQIGILQTYLENGSGGSQRRVRKITENGSDIYFYTEKEFITPMTRSENEYEISAENYAELLKEKKADCIPVSKTRICFNYKDQLFELDLYPFSDELAILELELRSPDQEIFFPDHVKIVKEVTGISEYSNAALANAGAFPSEIKEIYI